MWATINRGKMEIRQNWKPIKLKAVDDQDLQVFSQFLLRQ